MGLADLDELDISILQRIHGTENEAWEGDFSRRCVICMNDIARRSIFAAIRTNPLFCCVLHPLLLIRSEVLRILAMGILQSGFLWLPPMLDSQLAMIGSRGSCSLLILNKMHHIRLDDDCLCSLASIAAISSLGLQETSVSQDKCLRLDDRKLLLRHAILAY